MVYTDFKNETKLGVMDIFVGRERRLLRKSKQAKKKVQCVNSHTQLFITTHDYMFRPFTGSLSGRSTPRSRNVYNYTSHKNSSLQ